VTKHAQTLWWTPRAKERPRATVRNGKAIMYTPSKTTEAEKVLAEQWEHPPVEGPIAVSLVLADGYITVTIEDCPPHISKKLRGDIDNYAKTVLDGLNGVAFIDDRQIVRLEVTKL
jgi:crossover junction endodeoxyribonuclease RusA